MKQLPAPATSSNSLLSNIRHDAACAEKYSRELREFYMAFMDAPIRKADFKTAARLQTLINEICCAAHRTSTRLERLASVSNEGEQA